MKFCCSLRSCFTFRTRKCSCYLSSFYLSRINSAETMEFYIWMGKKNKRRLIFEEGNSLKKISRMADEISRV